MTFIESFEKKVKETITKHKLADKKEKIIVACSGGKDSCTLLFLLKKFGFNLEALHINLGIGSWSEKNQRNAEKICDEMGVKLNTVYMKDFVGKNISEISENKCRVCSINKRWLLNKKARELGGKKLAMGHNLDDEAESILMNVFRGNIIMGLGTGPKIGILQDKKFVQRIRPLYFCKNTETKKYAEEKGFAFSSEICPCSPDVFRRQIRNWLKKLEVKNSEIKENIVKWFLERLPELRKKYSSKTELKYCSRCGEPSRNEICKRCEVLEKIN